MVQVRDELSDPDPGRETLSALADGEVDSQVASGLVSRWREDGDTRSAWHAYQLIGDVLRSDELAAGQRDRAFVRRLHASLAAEAVVLAPVDEPRSVRRLPLLRRWATPLGVAAGVTLVVGTLLVTRMAPVIDSTTDAKVDRPRPLELAAAASSPMASPAPAVLLRDQRLDRYLAAHKQYQGANALGPTAGFIRSATYDMATR